MINLSSQLISFLFSFLYGVLFGVFIKINYSILFNVNKLIKIIGTFFFMVDMSLFYFIVLKFINNGFIHIYFFILFLMGWLLFSFLLDKYVKR